MKERKLLQIALPIFTMASLLLGQSYSETIEIPSWIKSNAKWWATNQINDSDFVQGIQYLIKHEIIKIPKTNAQSGSAEQKIPAWIKNNAGWWADGKISDNDFVQGIQYLIKINIIKVGLETIVKLSSTEFENNGIIPATFTCDGENTSPPLTITGVPEKAKSLALIVDDPDAPGGTFTHWTAWNIFPQKSSIAKAEGLEFQGRTDFGTTGYGGPCPPSGTHRYFFKLYALDSMLDLKSGATRQDLELAINGHIIEKTELVGKYTRG